MCCHASFSFTTGRALRKIASVARYCCTSERDDRHEVGNPTIMARYPRRVPVASEVTTVHSMVAPTATNSSSGLLAGLSNLTYAG